MADRVAASSLARFAATTIGRFAAFGAVLGRTIGAAAARRIVPVWLGIGMVVAVLFGPTGMRAGDLVAAAWATPGLHLALWLAWLVAATPAARAVLDRDATGYLRALPVPRPWWWLIQGALLCGLQVPWAILWGRGAGAAAAVAATALGALAVAVTARLRLPGLLGGGRGPARPAAAAAPARPGSVAAGLARAHLRAVWRSRSLVGARGALIAAVGGALAGLLVRVNRMDADDAALYSLGVATVSLAMAAGGLGAPVVESQQRLGWLLASTGTGLGVGAVAAAAVVAGLGALLGAVYAAVLLALSGSPGGVAIGVVARAAVEAVLAGAAFAAIALRAAHGAVRRGAGPGHETIDGSRTVIVMTLVVIAGLLAVGVLGERALLLLLASGAAVTAAGIAPGRRPRREAT